MSARRPRPQGPDLPSVVEGPESPPRVYMAAPAQRPQPGRGGGQEEEEWRDDWWWSSWWGGGDQWSDRAQWPRDWGQRFGERQPEDRAWRGQQEAEREEGLARAEQEREETIRQRRQGEWTTKATRTTVISGIGPSAPQAFRAVSASISGLNRAAVSHIAPLCPRSGPESTLSR